MPEHKGKIALAPVPVKIAALAAQGRVARLYRAFKSGGPGVGIAVFVPGNLRSLVR